MKVDQHIHVLADRELIKQIDDFRFTNRIRTGGEAIRRLIRIGLSQEAGEHRAPSAVAAE